MTTTVLVFHPHRSASRVNAALAASAETVGIEARYLDDLYPDFQIDVAAEYARVLSAPRETLGDREV